MAGRTENVVVNIGRRVFRIQKHRARDLIANWNGQYTRRLWFAFEELSDGSCVEVLWGSDDLSECRKAVERFVESDVPKPRGILAHLAVHGNDFDFCESEQLYHGKPTQAPRGSWAKVEALRQRIERGEHLWHPQDSQDGVNDSLPMANKLGAILERVQESMRCAG